MINLTELDSSNEEYSDEVKVLAEEAKTFLMSHKWCKEIIKGYYELGWGKILCVFYFEILPGKSGIDHAVWVVVGDIPPAYIDIGGAKNGMEALKCYVDIMEEWVFNVKEGRSVEQCYPINVPPTIEYRNMLEARLNLIKNDFIK